MLRCQTRAETSPSTIGTTKLSTDAQRGATEGTPVLDKPSITSINKTVIGKSSAGMNSQGARPQTKL